MIDAADAEHKPLDLTGLVRLGRHQLLEDGDSFRIVCPRGTAKFSGLATSNLPKIYVVSVNDALPLYVGITKQSLRKRLRLGWKARGEHGYHGYQWRGQYAEFNLDIWCHTAAVDGSARWVETVEAEVVHLIRAQGQWPAWQTEIHFHQSDESHRSAAQLLLADFLSVTPQHL